MKKTYLSIALLGLLSSTASATNSLIIENNDLEIKEGEEIYTIAEAFKNEKEAADQKFEQAELNYHGTNEWTKHEASKTASETADQAVTEREVYNATVDAAKLLVVDTVELKPTDFPNDAAIQTFIDDATNLADGATKDEVKTAIELMISKYNEQLPANRTKTDAELANDKALKNAQLELDKAMLETTSQHAAFIEAKEEKEAFEKREITATNVKGHNNNVLTVDNLTQENGTLEGTKNNKDLNDEEIQSTVKVNNYATKVNAENISEVEDRVETNEGKIAVNEGKIAINEGKIAFNEGRIDANEESIRKHDGRIKENFDDIKENRGLINDNTTAIGNNTKAITNLRSDFERMAKDYREFKTKTNGAIAGMAAMANIPNPYTVGKFSFGAGVGHYESEGAVSVGFGYRRTENLTFKASIASSTGDFEPIIGAGMAYEFD